MRDPAPALGRPRLHLRVTDSTNARTWQLAQAGAPHGTLVTAGEQRAGRGRQGRSWSAPAGRALLCSLVIRDPGQLLSLAAGVAVAEVAEAADEAGRDRPERAQIKWPNDVLVGGRKVAGILVEGLPQGRWAVLGIGVNVAVAPEDLPPELRERAGTLGLSPAAVEPTLERLLGALARWLAAPQEEVVEAVRERDALLGRPLGWSGGRGRGAGIDAEGRLVVATRHGREALNAGEVHLDVVG